MRKPFPKRTVHLDFHTGPGIGDVGADFDADLFAQVFVDAHVDSVTLFAKCHHGHLYYDTDRPERHPGLRRDLDLLGEQIEALRRRGICAPIYLSVQCDEYAAGTYPQWLAIDPDGRVAKTGGGPLDPAWHIMDMSSPYQDYLAEQVDEVLRKFAPLDGLFLDMCWDQVSLSKWAIDAMRRRRLDPMDETDRARYAREVAHGYMARFKKMLDRAQKGHAPVGVWFNSRPKTNLHFEKKFLRHIEVECLPTGGWGYAQFPYVARYVRPLGLPTLSHTARFHRSWGDFGGLKPQAALDYECSLVLSQGMSGTVGDQLHPRGTLDKAAYELIGNAYRHIEACEPYVAGGKLLSDIAVIVNPADGDDPKNDGLGVIRALQQLHHQFDLLGPTAKLAGYELIIVPESVRIDAALNRSLQARLAAGGSLLVSGTAALVDSGRPVMKHLGIATHGDSPYTTTYLRPARSISRGIADTDHVMYERGVRMTPAPGATSLCRVVEPYFERTYEHFCSHFQTPPARKSRYAAIVEHGRCITFAVPIFRAYGRHGNVPCRRMLGNCIDRLLPRPLIRADGPSHLETSVVRKGRRTVVHLLSYIPMRRTNDLDIIEDAVPLVDLPLAVRLPHRPKRAVLAPAGDALPFEYADGYAHTRITTTGGHVLVVFES
jgi:hypothetical protein